MPQDIEIYRLLDLGKGQGGFKRNTWFYGSEHLYTYLRTDFAF
jgi:hypothetical protein